MWNSGTMSWLLAAGLAERRRLPPENESVGGSRGYSRGTLDRCICRDTTAGCDGLKPWLTDAESAKRPTILGRPREDTTPVG